MTRSLWWCVAVAAMAACGGGGGGGGSGGGAAGGTGGGSASPVAPETQLTEQPPAKIGGSAQAKFVFGCDQAACTFSCALDAEAFADCTSPVTRGQLGNGAHEFKVKAIAGGVVDETPAVASFEVDAVAPVASFSSTPAPSSNAKPSNFGLSCSESPCSFECSVDQAAFSACATPLSLEALSPGMHKLSVRPIDAVGNVGATIEHAFSLSFGWRTAAVNNSTACAISGERKLYCWGSDLTGQLGQGQPLSHNIASSAVPLSVGTKSDWATVIAGGSLMCATNVSGQSFCWGSNYSQQYGDPAAPRNMPQTAPFAVSMNHARTALGEDHACLIDASGALLCYGAGYDGNLGDGNPNSHDVATPTRVGTATWRSLSLGDHTCGIQTDGSLWCFGTNDGGECGQDPVTNAIATPMRVGTDTDWAQVSASAGFTCALKTNGAAYCFGYNGQGQLGDGTTVASHQPVRVGGTATFSSVLAATSGACGVKTDGAVVCWGANERGEIGSPAAVAFSSTPLAVALPAPAAALFGRGAARCALTNVDELLCWGENVFADGLLGRGVKGSEPSPVRIDSGFASLSLTSNPYLGTAMGGCGIKTSGQLVCWGVGRHVVTQAQGFISLTPTPVTQDTDWSMVKLSAESSPLTGNGSYNDPFGHTCAIRSGQLYCWGANGKGQLGQGNTQPSAVPVQVTAPVNDSWASVSVSTFNTCAITSGGKLYCWGDNASGQIGDSTNTQRLSPQQVGSATNWVEVSQVASRVTARRADGTLWVWGFAAASTPTQLDNATDWVSGRAGQNYSCGLKQNGSLHCKVVSGPVVAVANAADVRALLDFDSGACFQRINGALGCVSFDGTSWSPATYPLLPTSTDWQSYEVVNQLQCGIKTNGDRYCSGVRFAGSLGDGFEWRVPAKVVTPAP